MKKLINHSDYLISKEGKVFSTKHGRLKEIKLQNHKGYQRFGVTTKGISLTLKVHRELYKSYVNKDIEGLDINHIDGNKANNILSNLEAVSHKDNMAHASKNNLLRKGSANFSSKLCETDIPFIRSLYENKIFSQREIGRLYKVSHTTIKHIINRDKWQSVL